MINSFLVAFKRINFKFIYFIFLIKLNLFYKSKLKFFFFLFLLIICNQLNQNYGVIHIHDTYSKVIRQNQFVSFFLIKIRLIFFSDVGRVKLRARVTEIFDSSQ